MGLIFEKEEIMGKMIRPGKKLPTLSIQSVSQAAYPIRYNVPKVKISSKRPKR